MKVYILQHYGDILGVYDNMETAIVKKEYFAYKLGYRDGPDSSFCVEEFEVISDNAPQCFQRKSDPDIGYTG